MKFWIQLGVALAAAGGTLVLLGAIVYSEFKFMDQYAGAALGALCVLSGVAFVILTENRDNEETNPIVDKKK